MDRNPHLRLCLVLHNHQPIGNFDHVFEAAYQDSYLPFLEIWESYPALKISLHISGSLLEWLERRHDDYLERLAQQAARGRLEILGGAYYEPILTMLSSRDRIGQIAQYSTHLTQRFGAPIRGMWVPERVWEPSVASDIVAAGIEYTVLDDFHFRCAGLADDALRGYFVTEDAGRVLKLFPGSEPLRYLIPFQEPQATLDYLRDLAQRHPGATVVFADDGEKFGTWPETKRHVYDEGWLRKFFDLLQAAQSWLTISTLSEAIDQTSSQGKVYLPDASYREMTEWALPVEAQLALDAAQHQFASTEGWPQVRRFVRGGLWRNFKVKYAEANELYARMVYVSTLLKQAEQEGCDPGPLAQAREHLYRGQCNCPYWHGAFGGLYLPHLRHAVYHELIAAENLIESAQRQSPQWVEGTADDYNFDAKTEIRLASDRLVAWLEPNVGGRMYELDVRAIGLNLLATLQRRPEAYHGKVRNGATSHSTDTASIHDRIVFKQSGLEQRLHYDAHPRKSLLDHFWAPGTSLEQVAQGRADELGDFHDGVFQAKLRQSPQRIQVVLERTGTVAGHTLQLTKGVTLTAGSDVLEIAYFLENLPEACDWIFAVEFQFAGLPAAADDRFFHIDQRSLGPLQTQLDLELTRQLALVDQWQGIEIGLSWDQPAHLWTFPVETVSQSEGGFELVHQSVAVIPHWRIIPDRAGKWSAVVRMALDTARAAQRIAPPTLNTPRWPSGSVQPPA